MAQINIQDLCASISERFRGNPVIRRIEDVTEITETIPPGDCPVMVCYPESHEGAVNSETQMNTFGGGAKRPVVQETPVIHVDIYIALIGQSSLAQVMVTLLACWQELLGVFRSETTQPYFDNDDVKSFTWEITRVELRFAGNRYWGISGQITVRSF